MKPNKKINTDDTGALIRLLSARKITQARFSIDMPATEIANALYAAYTSEVRRRGRTMELDDDTRTVMLDCAEWLADPHGKTGLMLQGRYGNGKTTMLHAICDIINLLYDSALSTERVQIKFIKAKDIARIGADDSQRERYMQLVTEDLLAIDDLGEEPAEIVRFGMTHTPVKDLLAERYSRQKFTIVSTNLINTATSPQLSEHYGERVVDRFREMMKIVVFRHPSYRSRTPEAGAAQR